MHHEWKYRIWDKSQKSFVWKGLSLTASGKLLKFNQEVTNEDNYIINFFTGVMDKYDKEIFVDDILEHTIAHGGNLNQEVGIVSFNPTLGAFCLDGNKPLLELFSLRKLGNPHENPVLFTLYLKKNA